MELLNVSKAGAAWLMHIRDLNPRGKSIAEDLLQWLGDAYHFTSKPSSITDLDETKGLKFAGGQFQVRDDFFIDVELRIYNDGFVGDTRSSTEDTDRFLEDILQTFSKEFNLPFRDDMIRRKLYHSEVTVRMDKGLAFLNSKLSEFSNKLASLSGIGNAHMEPSGLKFWALETPNTQLSEFVIERELGSTLQEGRYWSKARFHTSQHLEMLKALEGILTY